MSTIIVPERRLSSFLLLAKLSDESIADIFSVLANQPVQLLKPEFASSLAREIRSIPLEDGSKVIDTLVTLYPAILSLGTPLNVFIEDLVKSFSEQLSEKADFDPTLASNLSNALQKLLRIPSLSIGAKATDVLFQIERSYSGARVISDVRPVFDLETDEISAALVIHTLKLEYFSRDADNSREFFISLDATDIDNLINTLTRAKRKAKKLRELLQSSSITYVDSEQP
jgi:hypothetical protein